MNELVLFCFVFCFYKIRERQTHTEMWKRGDKLNLRYRGNRGWGTERAGDRQTDTQTDRQTESVCVCEWGEGGV